MEKDDDFAVTQSVTESIYKFKGMKIEDSKTFENSISRE